ncbi:hypothetical protein EYF80_029260 [Liparis tanakae]|uniref:Uncharacterized protein n=1 Tax=Liparis tanakae TaxID=230148 RepID=A0A4Z2H3U6_9TELE|nr:hypothetical protein EYF80_029260 [Liparis tanakae]
MKQSVQPLSTLITSASQDAHRQLLRACATLSLHFATKQNRLTAARLRLTELNVKCLETERREGNVPVSLPPSLHPSAASVITLPPSLHCLHHCSVSIPPLPPSLHCLSLLWGNTSRMSSRICHQGKDGASALGQTS